MPQISIKRLKKNRFTVLNNDVIGLLNESVWLCGGALRVILDGKTPNDYDLFFHGYNAALETEDKLENLGYRKIFVCPKGELTTFSKNNVKVQVIKKRFYSSMEDCINTFDFNAACAGMDNHILSFKKEFISDNRKKLISINKLTYPTATLARLYKYRSYGFYINSAIRDVVERIYNKDNDIIDMELLYVD